MDDFFDSCVREELLAKDRRMRRIMANHLRHPDPRDPDRIDFDEEVPLDETPVEH